MNFWKLVRHGGAIYAAINKIIRVGTACVEEGRRPSNEEDILIIGAFEDLVRSGIVPLPDETIETVCKALDEIKAQL